jgi:hypothetical protein
MSHVLDLLLKRIKAYGGLSFYSPPRIAFGASIVVFRRPRMLLSRVRVDCEICFSIRKRFVALTKLVERKFGSINITANTSQRTLSPQDCSVTMHLSEPYRNSRVLRNSSHTRTVWYLEADAAQYVRN